MRVWEYGSMGVDSYSHTINHPQYTMFNRPENIVLFPIPIGTAGNIFISKLYILCITLKHYALSITR